MSDNLESPPFEIRSTPETYNPRSETILEWLTKDSRRWMERLNYIVEELRILREETRDGDESGEEDSSGDESDAPMFTPPVNRPETLVPPTIRRPKRLARRRHRMRRDGDFPRLAPRTLRFYTGPYNLRQILPVRHTEIVS